MASVHLQSRRCRLCTAALVACLYSVWNLSAGDVYVDGVPKIPDRVAALRSLGLDSNKRVCEKEIKKAFRYAVLKHHPDRNGGDDKRFLEIRAAYEALMKSGERERASPYGASAQHTYGTQAQPGGGGSTGNYGSKFTSGENGWVPHMHPPPTHLNEVWDEIGFNPYTGEYRGPEETQEDIDWCWQTEPDAPPAPAQAPAPVRRQPVAQKKPPQTSKKTDVEEMAKRKSQASHAKKERETARTVLRQDLIRQKGGSAAESDSFSSILLVFGIGFIMTSLPASIAPRRIQVDSAPAAQVTQAQYLYPASASSSYTSHTPSYTSHTPTVAPAPAAQVSYTQQTPAVASAPAAQVSYTQTRQTPTVASAPAAQQIPAVASAPAEDNTGRTSQKTADVGGQRVSPVPAPPVWRAPAPTPEYGSTFNLEYAWAASAAKAASGTVLLGGHDQPTPEIIRDYFSQPGRAFNGAPHMRVVDWRILNRMWDGEGHRINDFKNHVVAALNEPGKEPTTHAYKKIAAVVNEDDLPRLLEKLRADTKSGFELKDLPDLAPQQIQHEGSMHVQSYEVTEINGRRLLTVKRASSDQSLLIIGASAVTKEGDKLSELRQFLHDAQPDIVVFDLNRELWGQVHEELPQSTKDMLGDTKSYMDPEELRHFERPKWAEFIA